MALRVVLAGIVVLASPTRPLEPGKALTQYRLEVWKEGLPHVSVTDILQTRDGYLWLATQEGLARFDGLGFTTFDFPEAPEIGSGDVLVVYEDREGALWAGTRGGGLTALDGGVPEKIDERGQGPGEVVFALTEDREGRIWVGTLDGLYRLDGKGWIRFGEEEGLPGSAARAVLEDSAGTLWVGTRESGLSRLVGERFERWSEPVAGLTAAEVATLDIVSLLEDRSGGLWVGCRRNGLFYRAPGEASFTRVEGLEDAAVVDLLEDRDEQIWIATYGGGLARFDGEEVSSLTSDEGLADDIVLSLHEDREGSLWIGTSGGGLSRLRDTPITLFTTREGLLKNNAYCVLEDRSGALWVGTEGGGLSRIPAPSETGRRIRALTTADGLSSNSVTALLEDREGVLWIGTRDAGLNRMRDGRVAAFRSGPGSESLSIFSMIEDPGGRIWVGTVRSGLHVLEAGRLEPFAEAPELEGRSIFALGLDAEGRVLAGTDGAGLKILGADGVRTLTTEDGLSNSTIVALHADAAGDVWVGTYGGGLNRIRQGEVRVARAEDGLPNDRIFRIVEDDSGRLWMTCNDGIFSLEKRELEDFFAGVASSLEPVVYGQDQGLLSTECAAGTHPAGWRGRDGVLWFPTLEGVARLDPGRRWRNPVPPPVWIESVRIDGRSYSPRSSPRLVPGQERFELTYTGLSFLMPEKVRFRYRLEGFDPDWIEAGPARSTTYTNLPTRRNYRFVVTAANNDGLWNENGASFSFYLEPHFYETPVFVALAGFGLLTLVWGGYRLRVRQLVRRTRELERRVAERTAEVVAEKDRVKAANEELARLNQIKSEFLAIAAHDLKNPLTVILGFADRIRRGEQPAERVRGIGRSISASVRQMLSIISDLLDTTAIEAGQLRLDRQPTDLMSIALEVIARNQVRAAERGIELNLSGDLDTDFCIRVDSERIARVVDNLIGNAIKFSADGDSVTVHLERRCSEGGASLRLAVQDRGPGLSEEDQARLFRRFQRLASRPVCGESSTGVGLSIVKDFVRMHGGEVWVESQPGRGATFFVELPLDQEALAGA